MRADLEKAREFWTRAAGQQLKSNIGFRLAALAFEMGQIENGLRHIEHAPSAMWGFFSQDLTIKNMTVFAIRTGDSRLLDIAKTAADQVFDAHEASEIGKRYTWNARVYKAVLTGDSVAAAELYETDEPEEWRSEGRGVHGFHLQLRAHAAQTAGHLDSATQLFEEAQSSLNEKCERCCFRVHRYKLRPEKTRHEQADDTPMAAPRPIPGS